MSPGVDAIVVGLGAMGSATLYHLASRGVRVHGFDRFAPPHDLGSTHGLSRIIREAYYEHPVYVPLVQRAYTLWAELAERTGRILLRPTGGLMIGPAHGALVSGALRSARVHGLAHEMLSAAEVRARFPAFAVPDEMVALLEPRAGVLDPEACVYAHLRLARAAGAEIHLDEPVVRWSADDDGVVVTTGKRELTAGRVAICAGAWAPSLLGDASLELTVERQTMHWYVPARNAAAFAPDRCPIAMIEYAPSRFFYTLPDAGDGVKAALHQEGMLTVPDAVRREVDAGDVAPVETLLRRYLPDAAGRRRASATCLYTNTPDQHFLIEALPRHAQVLVISACSGHGFKFASAVGEAAADLLTDRAPSVGLDAFSSARRAALAPRPVPSPPD